MTQERRPTGKSMETRMAIMEYQVADMSSDLKEVKRQVNMVAGDVHGWKEIKDSQGKIVWLMITTLAAALGTAVFVILDLITRLSQNQP